MEGTNFQVILEGTNFHETAQNPGFQKKSGFNFHEWLRMACSHTKTYNIFCGFNFHECLSTCEQPEN